ncbi:MAG: Fe(2+)-trafficking protein [Deltaproteobacteria bacterium]|nr:MAG: Fe(2+)-trafficking protein [Deltaproteobacteria bacterium]
MDFQDFRFNSMFSEICKKSLLSKFFQWKLYQVKLINENRLDLSRIKDRFFLYRQMCLYLEIY